MLDYQKLAIERVRDHANEKADEYQSYLEQVCRPFHVNVDRLLECVLHRPVTINFHPDRLANNGKSIMESLIEQGQYHGQFRTGTTNGGKTAFIGGNRFLWEQRLFHNAYPQLSLDRPKYGALNILRYIDGASARFGSCYIVLKKEIIDRVTFSYGDSSTNPTTLCTKDTFVCVLGELLKDVQNSGKLLNQVVSSEGEALAVLLDKCSDLKAIGRNLDYCIEAHIHGDISLGDDVDCIYMDESFRKTIFFQQADKLCRQYGTNLKWIPERRINVDDIGELFRGPMIPVIAKRIDALFGDGRGVLNAALLGQASRDSELHPERWNEFRSEAGVFQYIKQLWHTIAYFG